MNVMKKTKLTAISLMMLCMSLVLSFAVTASAGDPTLANIASAVENTENAIQDLKIEYTCIRRPFGADENWQPSANERYPGWYKPETGVFIQKGNKIKLKRLLYPTTSATKQVEDIISYDGEITRHQVHSPDIGLITSGRWHGLRRWFNPILTLSASGEKKLSQEIADVETELVAGLHNVNGKSCRLLKMYRKTATDTTLCSFNVYVDPNSGYAPVKIEKYIKDFQCLEQTVEIKEFTKSGNVYIPSKAKFVAYNLPRGSKVSVPVYEQELTVTNIDINEGVEDSVFDLTFAPGTRVWNGVAKFSFVVPKVEIENEDVLEPEL